MSRGRVYVWQADAQRRGGGSVTLAVVPLPRLLEAGHGAKLRLRGRFVTVRNGGAVNEPDPRSGGARATPLGDAQPDTHGDFCFEPGRGGGRMDKVVLAAPDFRWRYIQASRFGEVNTYFHLDAIAAYVDGLLQELGAPSLPPVTAVVTAHAAATERDGIRDGVRRPSGRWFPFQGGHYRLPGPTHTVAEPLPVSPQGEIHLGPGWMLLEHGALVEAAGGPYRANASHNAGIIFHEYGHHITHHTADFAANALRRPDRQRNRKRAIDEGTCDYWAATMLDTPHVWAWHRRHDAEFPHRRCLTSAKTMADYDPGPRADPHANGTIWGAALWDLRTELRARDPAGVRRTDQLLLKTLLLLGHLPPPRRDRAATGLAHLRSSFPVALGALLHADALLYANRDRAAILSAFAARGIHPDPAAAPPLPSASHARPGPAGPPVDPRTESLWKDR